MLTLSGCVVVVVVVVVFVAVKVFPVFSVLLLRVRKEMGAFSRSYLRAPARVRDDNGLEMSESVFSWPFLFFRNFSMALAAFSCKNRVGERFFFLKVGGGEAPVAVEVKEATVMSEAPAAVAAVVDRADGAAGEGGAGTGAVERDAGGAAVERRGDVGTTPTVRAVVVGEEAVAVVAVADVARLAERASLAVVATWRAPRTSKDTPIFEKNNRLIFFRIFLNLYFFTCRGTNVCWRSWFKILGKCPAALAQTLKFLAKRCAQGFYHFALALQRFLNR